MRSEKDESSSNLGLKEDLILEKESTLTKLSADLDQLQSDFQQKLTQISDLETHSGIMS